MCVNNQLSNQDSGGFANSADFCRIFALRLSSLYKLAFLLTANHLLAERCTIASLDEALGAGGISNAAAEGWSKCAVIRNALRIVRREPFKGDGSLAPTEPAKDECIGWPFDVIISLPLQERFVFVLSVLERMLDDECSQLFGCAVTQIAPARIRALEFLSMSEISEKPRLTGTNSCSAATCNSATTLGRDQARA